jgi:hypothetical protein
VTIEFTPGLLPGKPDPKTQPALSKAWERMFEGQFEWVAPNLQNLIKPNLVREIQPEIHQFLQAATSRYQNSSAWCGASIVPDRGNQFVQIYGEFTVPEARVPKGGAKKKYYSATWIGLDGDRRYVDSTLPQVGTQQNTPGPDPDPPPLPTGLPPYYAWFQWWAPRRYTPELWSITGIPIDAGHDVMALIWAIAKTYVIVVFRNFTTSRITSFTMASPEHQHNKRRTKLYSAIISGATAEWIVEDPSQAIDPDRDDPPNPEPFADYKSVSFRHCVAGMAEAPGPATSEKVLTAPRFKRMYEVLPNPSRTRFISMPKRGDSDTQLVVEYGGFK